MPLGDVAKLLRDLAVFFHGHLWTSGERRGIADDGTRL